MGCTSALCEVSTGLQARWGKVGWNRRIYHSKTVVIKFMILAFCVYRIRFDHHKCQHLNSPNTENQAVEH